MKNQILILTACCLLFIVGSCTKFGKNITVEGNVINPINGNPYEGITIVLHKQNLKTIKTTITNANGHFEINASRLGEVLIRADNTNYKENYNLGWDVDGEYYYSVKVDKGEVMHVDYHLVPYAYLKLSINNTNCIDSDDKISVYRELIGVQGYETWSATHPYSQEGCQQTISPEYFKVLMGKYHFWWTVTKGGVSTTYNDTISLNKNEQKIYVIDY